MAAMCDSSDALFPGQPQELDLLCYSDNEPDEQCPEAEWDPLELLLDDECDAPGPDVCERREPQSELVLEAMEWQIDSSEANAEALQYHFVEDSPACAGCIPLMASMECMADQLEEFEQHFSPGCEADAPITGLSGCLSSNNMTRLTNNSGRVAKVVIKPAQPMIECFAKPAEPPPAVAEAAVKAFPEVDARPAAIGAQPSRAIPITQPLRAGIGLRRLERRFVVADSQWSGCQKSNWCTRENRHRGVCNNRASVPGANSSPGSNLAAQTPGLDDCSLDGQLAAAPVKEDPEHSQRAASEEASATEVRLDIHDADANCPESARRDSSGKPCFPALMKPRSSSGSSGDECLAWPSEQLPAEQLPKKPQAAQNTANALSLPKSGSCCARQSRPEGSRPASAAVQKAAGDFGAAAEQTPPPSHHRHQEGANGGCGFVSVAIGRCGADMSQPLPPTTDGTMSMPHTPAMQAPLIAAQDSADSTESNMQRADMDDDSAETCSERTIDNDLDMCNVTDVHCGLFRPASIIVDAHSPPATPDIFAAPLVSKPSQDDITRALGAKPTPFRSGAASAAAAAAGAAAPVSMVFPASRPLVVPCHAPASSPLPTPQPQPAKHGKQNVAVATPASCTVTPTSKGQSGQPKQGSKGLVQTSSGRIARPSQKTVASQASSDDLSELSHTEGSPKPQGKRKGGRGGKCCEKAKRRRMVGGVLKTIGTAAPGQQCTQCGTQVTPVWRAGPYGPKTLCNACGVRYMKQVKKK